MVTVPAATPVTTPLDEPTVATPGLPLLHTPPGVASVNVMVPNTHKTLVLGTTIGAGEETTDTVSIAAHPSGMVYIIMADPGVIPVTSPEKEPTVATDILLLLHVPPVGVPVNV